MWPWRQNVQFKYLVFWVQLLSFVAVIHVVVLYTLLFMQHGVNLHDSLTITARFASGDLPVVFMPFYKHVPGSIQQINAQGASNSKKQNLSKIQKLTKSQNINKQNLNNRPIVYKLVKPEIAKSKLNKNTKVSPKKSKLAIKPATKLAAKKIAPKLAMAKPVIKKLEPVKSKKISEIVSAAPETLQDSIKPVEQVSPKNTDKITNEKVIPEVTQVVPVELKNLDAKVNNNFADKNLDLKQAANPEASDTNKNNLNNDNSTVTSSVNSNNQSISTTISSSNNNQELAIGRKDLELLQLQDSLRGAVSQNWRPPLGFKRDLETVVEVFVDAAGVMERVDIKQTSGVLVFDASVELAINQVVWPSEAWGKSHTLTFKQ